MSFLHNIPRNSRLLYQAATSYVGGQYHGQAFDGVRAYCMFLGYPRSGHTLMASLVDAHPDAIMANELHALRYIEYGFGKRQLFYLLFQNSRDFARAGQTYTGYSYQVANQWQGRYRNLSVIGDKRADRSVVRLMEKPELLEKLRRTVAVPIKFIHLIRNPFDNIASMAQKTSRADLQGTIDRYFRLAEGVEALKGKMSEGDLFEVRLEDFIATPKPVLKNLCDFLGLGIEGTYLEDCAAIVFGSPRLVRNDVEWTPEQIQEVLERSQKFSFLGGYGFEG